MSAAWTVREVPTTVGPARVHRSTPRGRGSAPVIVLGHGAGGGVDAPDLQCLASVALATGFRVVLVDQPWRLAGRRIAPRPEVLDTAWAEVLAALRLRGPVIVGGRSAGARVACRTARQVGAVGVLALAYPVHPPGRPDRSRVGEIEAAGMPVTVLQGERDAFGSADELRAAAPAIRVIAVPGGDHGLARASLGPALTAAVGEALAHLRRVVE